MTFQYRVIHFTSDNSVVVVMTDSNIRVYCIVDISGSQTLLSNYFSEDDSKKTVDHRSVVFIVSKH